MERQKILLLVFSIFITPLTFALPAPLLSTLALVQKEIQLNKMKPSIELPVINGEFNAWNCTNEGANSVCIAAGYKDKKIPVLFKSKDGGRTWDEVIVRGVPTDANEEAEYTVTSCTGKNKNTLCIAAGQTAFQEGGRKIFLVQSADRGETWELQSIQNAPKEGVIMTAKCIGSGKQAFCVAAGHGDGYPMIVQTKNGGAVWENVPSFADYPWSGWFYSSACLYNFEMGATCYVDGNVFDTDTNEVQFFKAFTIDNGNKWTDKL